MHDAGARILLGSDTPNPYVVSGFSLHQELRNLVDSGLTPYEAIKAGTHDAAECLGELEEFGTIRTGLRADLILVEDNPLDDVGNAARRIGVMARGRWFLQSELQTMLDALAVKHATEENPDGVMLRGRWYPRSEMEAMAEWCEEKNDAQNESQRDELAEAVLSSERIFLAGGNRSVSRYVVMNLKQLGLHAYVADDATVPAIEKGDLLITFSSAYQWTWTTIYNTASAAKSSGASVVLLTDGILSTKTKDVFDLVFALGPDFDEAAAFFLDKLVTATTVSLRAGVPVGKMTYDDAKDTYTIHGAGNEIWHAWDQFYFTHKKVSADGSITARIDSVEPRDDRTEAGLMIRDTTASDSAFAAVSVSAENRILLAYRLEAGKDAVGIDSDRNTVKLPHWIKLIREGNTFRARHSEDGKKWEELKHGDDVITIEMDDPVHIGLAVCSEAGPAIAAEAKISSVSFGGDWSPSGRFIRSEDIGYEAWDKP